METGLTARSQPGRISRATLTEQLEEALRADILDGVFLPGRRLRALEISERYGVSATPLREALQRLAAEGLVELDPRSGATVARISESDLHDVYEMLSLFACMALERSIERGDEAWAAEVRERFEALVVTNVQLESGDATDDEARRRSGSAAAEAHWRFHHALYIACGSPWLLRFVATLHAHAERYRRLALQAPGSRRDSRHEHEGIMVATLARDSERAVTALRDHLALTVSLLSDQMGDQTAES
jgi:GntR family transcriptional regulator, carbon starvation induced regulator